MHQHTVARKERSVLRGRTYRLSLPEPTHFGNAGYLRGVNRWLTRNPLCSLRATRVRHVEVDATCRSTPRAILIAPDPAMAPPPLTAALLQFFLQPDLDQRLIRHVARVRSGLDAVEKMDRQPQGNRLCRWLQIGKGRAHGLGLVKVLRRIVRLPKSAFHSFGSERRHRLKRLVHKLPFLSDAYPVLKSHGSTYRHHVK